MKDRIPPYPGRVTAIPVSGQAHTYDVSMADAPTEPGTPPTKANLLSDETAAFLGITQDNPTVSDALRCVVPRGCILLWSGSTSTIPGGWALCNGQNGTPDLRDRFVVGAGSTYAVAAKGGATTVTLTTSQIPSHTHSIASDGDHTHTVSFSAQGSNTSQSALTNSSSGGSSRTTSSSGAHTHTAGSSGGGGAHENLPPYYALCYIMKV